MRYRVGNFINFNKMLAESLIMSILNNHLLESISTMYTLFLCHFVGYWSETRWGSADIWFSYIWPIFFLSKSCLYSRSNFDTWMDIVRRMIKLNINHVITATSVFQLTLDLEHWWILETGVCWSTKYLF